MKSIFEFVTVNSFLKDRLGDSSKRKGLKSSLARRLNTQSSYISQILNDQAKLSLEQAFESTFFFQMNSIESKYFLLMNQFERAGTENLKEFYKKEMQVVWMAKDNLQKRFENESEILPEEAKEQYYSEWIYLATHVLVSIPEFNTPSKIAMKLRATQEKIEHVLQFLVDYNFLDLTNNKYNVGKRSLHLEKNSLHQFRHQLNWRLKAVQQLQNTMDDKNINYAGVYSLSKKDAEQIKENIVRLLKENLKIVAPSKEEVMYCTLIDFFEI
jgi:uncharacterized protein (TIGR02147 family)